MQTESFASEWGLVTSFCDYGNEPSGFITSGEFLM